ncbi:hypothetical protein GWI33_003581, partial [Rhynchophorus ferrugineus]
GEGGCSEPGSPRTQPLRALHVPFQIITASINPALDVYGSIKTPVCVSVNPRCDFFGVCMGVRTLSLREAGGDGFVKKSTVGEGKIFAFRKDEAHIKLLHE